MKKLWILTLAVCFACSMAAAAQEMGKSCDMGKTAAKAPLKTLKGTVKAEGDKITFAGHEAGEPADIAKHKGQGFSEGSRGFHRSHL